MEKISAPTSFPSNNPSSFSESPTTTWQQVASGVNRQLAPSTPSVTNLANTYTEEQEKTLESVFNVFNNGVRPAIENKFSKDIVKSYIMRLYVFFEKLHPDYQDREDVQRIILTANNHVKDRGIPIPPELIPKLPLHAELSTLSIQNPEDVLKAGPVQEERKKIVTDILALFEEYVKILPYVYKRAISDELLEKMKALISIYPPKVQESILNSVSYEVSGENRCYFHSVVVKYLLPTPQAATNQPINATSATIISSEVSNAQFPPQENVRKHSRGSDSEDEKPNQPKKPNNSTTDIIASQISTLSLEEHQLGEIETYATSQGISFSGQIKYIATRMLGEGANLQAVIEMLKNLKTS